MGTAARQAHSAFRTRRLQDWQIRDAHSQAGCRGKNLSPDRDRTGAGISRRPRSPVAVGHLSLRQEARVEDAGDQAADVGVTLLDALAAAPLPRAKTRSKF